MLADVVVCGAGTLRDCEDDDEDDDDECEEPHPPNIRPAHTAASSRLMPGATMSGPIRRPLTYLHLRTYRQATTDGCSTGWPAEIDQARRMNCAWVQASGVAENVGSPGRKPG